MSEDRFAFEIRIGCNVREFGCERPTAGRTDFLTRFDLDGALGAAHLAVDEVIMDAFCRFIALETPAPSQEISAGDEPNAD